MDKDDWVEGARSCNPTDPCPQCGEPCIIGFDFKKLGKHEFRACLAHGLFVDGELAAPIEIYKEAP